MTRGSICCGYQNLLRLKLTSKNILNVKYIKPYKTGCTLWQWELEIEEIKWKQPENFRKKNSKEDQWPKLCKHRKGK